MNDQDFRLALRELLDDLRDWGGKPSLAWLMKYYRDGSEGDPVRRAWEACCCPVTLFRFIHRTNRPQHLRRVYWRTDPATGQDVSVPEGVVLGPEGEILKTPAGYEVNYKGLFTVVLPTWPDLIRFYHPAPVLDDFLTPSLCYGDA